MLPHLPAPALPPSSAWTRRQFLGFGLGAGLALWNLPAFSQPLTTSETPALPTSHFPTRLHAFVWRNWSLVEPTRLAQVVGTSAEKIIALGQSLGLGEPPTITPTIRTRSAITVIRRNWHLLPYDQLLTLLGWTAEELSYALQEDDFLFIKLGSLKPKIESLPWVEPDAAAQLRAAEIAALVKKEFPGGLLGQDPLFSFVAQLSAPQPAIPVASGKGLRFCSSYFALYGDPLSDPTLDPYPDGYLARLAASGVTGVWLQAVLTKLCSLPWAKDAGAAARREALQRLTARAARHGIRVFLYLNEPRTLPIAQFADHPDWKGVSHGPQASLCTSVPEVRQALREAIAQICRDAPELGGFFTITASENPTHCWSHGRGQQCPRCAQRKPAEVIAELNGAFLEGIRAAGGRQQLIAWDWGWNDDWAVDAVERLPEGVAVMSVSEWGLPIERGDIKSTVGEYSMSAVGPGPRARKTWAAARRRGLPAIAKIQAGNTWELSSVPYIPAVANVAQHAAQLKAEGVDGIMLGWTLGGHPSPNLEAVDEILSGGSLSRLAQRRYGPAADAVVAFWEACSAAFREFPFHVGCVYEAPFQMGPANLLWPQSTGYRSTMVGLPYDSLAHWRAIYPAEIWISQLEKVATGFFTAAETLRRSIDQALLSKIEEEIRMATAAALHWESAAGQARFITARDTNAAPAEKQKLLEAEISRAQRLHALQSRDSRIGFEASNQYYYVPLDLVEKVINCRFLAAAL